MAMFEKLVAHFLSDPPTVKFSEVQRVPTEFGFVEVRSSGSHHVFRHPAGRMQVVPKKGGKQVKRVYVKRIVTLLDLKTWYEGQNSD